MGIFDFFSKPEEKKHNSEEKKKETEINKKKFVDEFKIVRDASELEEVSCYDNFGKEIKMKKKEWIQKKLEPAIKKNWNNVENLHPVIIDAFSKNLYNEVKEAVFRFYAKDHNFERKLNLLGTFYIKTGTPEQAIELYERNLNSENMTESLCISYAEALEMEEKHSEAEKKYLDALEKNPNSSVAFKRYFDIVKKRSNLEYESKIEKLSSIKGNWRAKVMEAVIFFKRGDKEMGTFYLATALKESSYNSEVMSLTSSIYILNEMYEEFEKYVLPYYAPEKHGVQTTLNILEYYYSKKKYKEGLELCKFVSKYPWIEYYKKFMELEEKFLKLKIKKIESKSKNKIEKNHLLPKNKFFSTNKPLWYSVFNKPEFLLNQTKRVKPNILILPLTSIGEKSEIAENLAISLPLYLNENLHYKTNLNYQVAIGYRGENLFVSKTKYSVDYMKKIRESNTNLNYVLAGNILKSKNVERYEIEVYLYDVFNEQKLVLVSRTYDEQNLFLLQNDLLKKINEFFDRNIAIKYERDMGNLVLFSQKLKFLLEPKEYKKHHSWRYKKLLSDQIDVVLEDRKNDLKKINLLALLYEIKRTNSQLLKEHKPLIYSMNIEGIFETQTLKVLAPIIFNIFDDEENFLANLEALNITDSTYVEWVKRFIEEKES